MKRLNSTDTFFANYIARLNFYYQFNQNLSFRLVSELNTDSGLYLIQPLLQWNPTPFTIFYVGGNNKYLHNDKFDAYRLDDAQLYLKFQYQLGD